MKNIKIKFIRNSLQNDFNLNSSTLGKAALKRTMLGENMEVVKGFHQILKGASKYFHGL